jgi:MFS family permease
MNRVAALRAYPLTFHLAFASTCLFFSSMHLLITPLPLYIEEIGGTPSAVGWATGTFAIAAIVSRPYIGRLVDTWGRKPMMIIGALLFVIGPLFYALASSVPLLFIGRGLTGVGIAAFTTGYYALMADVTPPAHWGEALGLAGVAPFLSLIVASPLGTSLSAVVTFPLVFVTAGLLAFGSLVISLLLSEPRRVSTLAQPENADEATLYGVFRLRGVWASSLATLAAGLTYGAVFSFLPLFARDRLLGNVGFFFTALGIVAVLTRFLLGRVSDRVGRAPVILPMFILLGISMAALNWTGSVPLFLTMGVLYGGGFGGARVGLDALVVDSAPPRARGRALGILYTSLDTGVGAGSVLMGMMAAFAGYGRIYLLLGGLCLATAFVFAAVTTPLRHR